MRLNLPYFGVYSFPPITIDLAPVATHTLAEVTQLKRTCHFPRLPHTFFFFLRLIVHPVIRGSRRQFRIQPSRVFPHLVVYSRIFECDAEPGNQAVGSSVNMLPRDRQQRWRPVRTMLTHASACIDARSRQLGPQSGFSPINHSKRLNSLSTESRYLASVFQGGEVFSHVATALFG